MELELVNNSQLIDADELVLQLTKSSQGADLGSDYQTSNEADIKV